MIGDLTSIREFQVTDLSFVGTTKSKGSLLLIKLS